MINSQLYIVTSILMLMAGELVSGMLLSRGPCPTNMTAVGDLNMDKYMGKWHVQYMYKFSSGKNLPKCRTIEFARKPDGKIEILRREINPKTDTFVDKKRDVLRVDSKGGTFVVSSTSKVIERGIEVYVLDTDYDQFAIHYVCLDSDSVLNFQWAVILTRKQTPTPEVLPVALKLANSSGIHVDKLQKIEQDDCPKN